MSSVFQAERAVSPVDGSELWVVLDAELMLHREASDFCGAVFQHCGDVARPSRLGRSRW